MCKIITCEFCNSKFVPRPQVKNPRACKNCQKKRQRENERAWREKNKGLYDGKYHRIQRGERKKKIRKIVDEIFNIIKTGQTFLKKHLNLKALREAMEKFFQNLGIRYANKLWSTEKGLDTYRLEEVFGG